MLELSIVFSERMFLCIQGTNNTARDLGFSERNITKIDFQWSKQPTGEWNQQAKYSGVVFQNWWYVSYLLYKDVMYLFYLIIKFSEF